MTIAFSEWDFAQDEFRILIEHPKKPADKDGRRSFTMLWYRDGARKAQCFFANPDVHRDYMLAAGLKESIL